MQVKKKKKLEERTPFDHHVLVLPQVQRAKDAIHLKEIGIWMEHQLAGVQRVKVKVKIRSKTRK
jgi:hypothetical protein